MNLRKRGKWMEGEGKDVDAPLFKFLNTPLIVIWYDILYRRERCVELTCRRLQTCRTVESFV